MKFGRWLISILVAPSCKSSAAVVITSAKFSSPGVGDSKVSHAQILSESWNPVSDSHPTMSPSWQDIAAAKKLEQKQSIPKEWIPASLPPESQLNVLNFPRECNVLSAKELEITETLDTEVLLAKLAKAEWTSVEVTTAFYKRAIVAQQVVNCLTEIYVEKALKWAAELDDHLKKTGKVVGPLHGLPISLKDQLCIKGMDTVMGYVSWIGKKAEKNAVLVDILLEAGAVPFVRTNVPQTLMWPETYNLVFGRTLNPFNRSLTCGGSSGGEGALIGMRGSPLGVGSDVGGSVRIPASFNGLFGLRPSYDRIPYEGAANSLLGQESIASVLGSLCPTLSGIKTFFKAVLEAKPWDRDPVAHRLPWDEESYRLVKHNGGKNMVFAFLWHDEQLLPHPPVNRALRMTKAALEAAGHSVVDWKPLRHGEIYAVMGAIWGADGGEDFEKDAAPTGEPVLHTMLLNTSADIPEPPAYRLKTKRSAYELWQLHKEKRALRKSYLDQWMATKAITGTGRPVDAIISPVAPYAAPPHGCNRSAAYTMVWNGLNYPACAFPVTTVDPKLDVAVPAHSFFTDDDKTNYELYNPETFKDAPVGLQLVGRTHEDEAVIAMTEVVCQALQSRQAV